MQPAQRPTIAEDGAFLNHGNTGRIERWLATRSFTTSPYIAAKQTRSFRRFRQEFTRGLLPTFDLTFTGGAPETTKNRPSRSPNGLLR